MIDSVSISEDMAHDLIDNHGMKADYAVRWTDSVVGFRSYSWNVIEDKIYRHPNSLTDDEDELVPILILIPTAGARLAYLNQ